MMSEKLRTNLFWLVFIAIGMALLIAGIKTINIGLKIIGIVFMVLSAGMIIAYNIRKN